MGEYIFDKYKILETLSSGEHSELYTVEEIKTGKKFALRKIFIDTFEPFYKKAIKTLKKLSRNELDTKEKGDSPPVVEIFTEIEYTYLLIDYKDKEGLERVLSYPSTGRILNKRYVVLQGIARGSFGVVYLVKDLSLPGKYWALKEMQDEGNFFKMEKRFRAEAETLSTLEHPNIPRMNDFFSEKEKLYLIMDYIEGESLSEKIKNLSEGEYFPEDKVIGWAIKLCSVLKYLHSREKPIVFRALKPENIMITPDSDIKLLDFAIARIFEGPKSRKTTQTFQKEGYTPPEQWVGRAEPRSDIYSLGATLHHLLTGVHPKNFSPAFPPVEEYNPSISPFLSKIISRALEEKRKNRFQTAEEMEGEILKLYEYRKGHYHLARAKEYENKGDYFNANFEYMKSLDLFRGGNYEVLSSIASCHEKLGFNDKALEFYNKALKLDLPKNLRDEIRERIKSLCLTKQLDYKEAIEEALKEEQKEKEEIKKEEEKSALVSEQKTRPLKIISIMPAIICILITGALLSFLAFHILGRGAEAKKQEELKIALRTASTICKEALEDLEKVADLASKTKEPSKTLREGDPEIDYVYILDNKEDIKDEIILRAFEGEKICGTRVIEEHELKNLGDHIYKKAEIPLIETEGARPVSEKMLQKAMVLEYIAPLKDEEGNITGIIWCGKIINRNLSFVESIHENIFKEEDFKGKPVGNSCHNLK